MDHLNVRDASGGVTLHVGPDIRSPNRNPTGRDTLNPPGGATRYMSPRTWSHFCVVCRARKPLQLSCLGEGAVLFKANALMYQARQRQRPEGHMTVIGWSTDAHTYRAYVITQALSYSKESPL